MSCGALQPSAHMSTSVVASVFGWSRRPQLCGGTESNSVALRHDRDGLGQRNPLLYSDWPVSRRPKIPFAADAACSDRLKAVSGKRGALKVRDWALFCGGEGSL